MPDARILILDDDAMIRTLLSDRLERSGHTVRVAGSLAEARALLCTGVPDLTLLAMQLPDGSGTDLLPELVGELGVACIMMTARAGVEAAVAALKLGARDFLEKPISYERLGATVAGALEVAALRREVRALRGDEWADGVVIGTSPAMQDLFRAVERVAPAGNTAVLIEGETGTGKGMIAKLIHRRSARAQQPFVKVTCSAVADRMMESELFGHEEGAFADARELKHGLVELADHGTLFLDNIDALSPRLQGRLLQVIQHRTFRRMGGTRDLRVDTRLIAGSRRDLQRAVAAGVFRADLHARLRVAPMNVPPLRERASDIPDLAMHFVDIYRRELGGSLRGITPEALELLCSYDWPGNVRELRNVIERVVLLARCEALTADALPPEVRAPERGNNHTISMGPAGLDLVDLERTLLLEAMRRAEGNRTLAGRLLGLSRHQIRTRLRRYGEDA